MVKQAITHMIQAQSEEWFYFIFTVWILQLFLNPLNVILSNFFKKDRCPMYASTATTTLSLVLLIFFYESY
jgi:F0F1-type ATP synthase membrane subunit a